MFENKCYLAPLSDYGNLPFRLLCQSYGAEGTIVPLVSAKAIVINKKGFKELDPNPKEKFAGVQLFGAEPADMQGAAKRVAKDFPFVKFIDINCGCPVRKVLKTGAGSSLLNNPANAGEIIKGALTCGLPITVKMRILTDSQKTIEFAKTCEGAGAAALFVHGRTQPQGYSGKADWEIIKSIAESVNVPVIGSGDIKNKNQGKEFIKQYSCSGFMIGRAALRDPSVFSDKPTSTFAQKLELFKDYYAICAELDSIYYPDLKAKAIQFFSGFENSVELRIKLCQTKSIEEIEDALGFSFTKK